MQYKCFFLSCHISAELRQVFYALLILNREKILPQTREVVYISQIVYSYQLSKCNKILAAEHLELNC